jgi:cellobiose phosphorylase
MVTAAGSGYRRWREDATCDDCGSYVFFRDVSDGKVWLAGFQPSGAEPDAYDVNFKEDRAEFFRRDGVLTTMEVLVSAEEFGTIRRGGGGQPGLWLHGISGDLPIVLLHISETEDLDIVRQLLHTHEYWRTKQLAADLVMLNERESSYNQDLQSALETLVRTSQSRSQIPMDAPSGRVLILWADLMSADTRALLTSMAQVVLVRRRGRLSDQLDRAPEATVSA